MKRAWLSLLLLALVAPLSGRAAPQPPAAKGAAKPRLVFFMNPNGRPCQLQDQILREMDGELGPKVEVVYYRTTVARDLDGFRQYGIRSLPMLLLTDASGKELRRATPGIQSAAQVRQLVAN